MVECCDLTLNKYLHSFSQRLLIANVCEAISTGHNHPITVVIGYGDNLVSGDENGDIVVRKYFDDGSFRVKHTIKGSGSPCNCIDVWKSIIVAG